ncbi:MAG: CheR family methyltransferase [Methanosarcinales archaeon]
MDFELLKKIIFQNTSLNCQYYKDSYLQRRIAVRMRANNVSNYLEYIRVLKKNPKEYIHLIDAITINVTEFFRNPETYEAIEREVLPKLIKANSGTRNIRAWSAGCASGEEPYSLAILLLKAIKKKYKDNNFKIIIYGTDIDQESLNKAKEGIYTGDQIKNVKKSILNQYFNRIGDKYIIKDEVKQLITFQKHDLISRSGRKYTALDLIMCRNVVIYFSNQLKEKLFMDFYKALKKSGYLILGKTEFISGEAKNLFKVVNNKERIYQK